MPPLGITMRTLVEQTKDHLLGPRRSPLNRVYQALDASPDDTSMVLAYDTGQIMAGTQLAIDDEVMYVWEVQGQQVEVAHGHRGTTIAAHNEDATVEVEPRFPNGVILRALADEIRSWPEDVFAVEELVALVGSGQDAIPLLLTGNAPIHRVLEVHRSPESWEEDWLPILGWRLRRGAAYAIAFGHEFGTDSTLRITVARSFDVDVLTSGTDVGTVGLTDTMLDIPPLGAAARLLAYAEASRTDDISRSGSETTATVPSGSRLRTGVGFLQLRNARLADERRRLLAKYGHGLALR